MRHQCQGESEFGWGCLDDDISGYLTHNRLAGLGFRPVANYPNVQVFSPVQTDRGVEPTPEDEIGGKSMLPRR